MIVWMSLAQAQVVGWEREGSPDFVIEKVDGHEQGKALRLRNAEHSKTEAGAATQTLDPRPYRNGLVRVSGWVRGTGFFYGIVNLQQQQLSSDRVPVSSKKWTRVSVVVAVPENADRLRFGVAVSGRGTIDLDDVQIENVVGVPHHVPYAVQQPLERPLNLAIE